MKKNIFLFAAVLFCAWSTVNATFPVVEKVPQDLSNTVFVQEGSPKTLVSLKGTPVVLCYGADFCPSCHKALPGLDQLSENWGTALKVAVVTTADRKVYKSMTANTFFLETFGDEGGELRTRIDLKAFPTFLFINDAGMLVAKTEGSPSWNSPEMMTFMRDFVQNKGHLKSGTNTTDSLFSQAILWVKKLFS